MVEKDHSYILYTVRALPILALVSNVYLLMSKAVYPNCLLATSILPGIPVPVPVEQRG